jgi:mRNA interferase RelE/StbE
MNFKIFYDNQPLKFLELQNKDIVKRILDKIEEILQTNPVPSDSKHIIGERGVYRLRIGDYRALYRIDYQESKIIIFKIDKRERVY